MCKQWFSEHQDIQLLAAPVNSPDLNPLENFWAETTRNWVTCFPRNNATLESNIVDNWEKWRGNVEYFKNLYESMPRRMNAVIDDNGGSTGY